MVLRLVRATPCLFTLYRLTPRCQSARGRLVDHVDAEKKVAEELETRRKREDAELAFQAWLRQKQREAAESRREHRHNNNNDNNNRPTNEVAVQFHTPP